MWVSGPSPRSLQGRGTERLPGGHAAPHIILWWWLSQLRWPVALLALLPPRLVGRRCLRRFCIHVQVVWNRPLTMATATALAPVMRAAAAIGSSNLMGTSATPGQATTSRVPASHAPRPMPHPESDRGLLREALRPLHRQTRCPGSRHRESTSRARPACPVHARRHGSGNRVAAGIGRTAEHATWSPPLPSHPTPDDPRHARAGRIVTRRPSPKDWAGHEDNRDPVTMRYEWTSQRRGDLSRLAS